MKIIYFGPGASLQSLNILKMSKTEFKVGPSIIFRKGNPGQKIHWGVFGGNLQKKFYSARAYETKYTHSDSFFSSGKALLYVRVVFGAPKEKDFVGADKLRIHPYLPHGQ